MIDQNSPWFPYRSHPKNKMVCIARYTTLPTSKRHMQEYKIPGTAWPRRFHVFEHARQYADELNVKEAAKAEAA